MAIKCCSISQFCPWDDFGNLNWKFGRLAKTDTYIVIFSRNQEEHYKLFKKVKDKVKVLAEIEDCYNAVHPGISKNRIVVFEKLDGKSNSK